MAAFGSDGMTYALAARHVAVARDVVITSTQPAALVVGASGQTDPALRVDASAQHSATGMCIASAAAGAGVIVSVLSSATDEGLTLAAKGAGTITFASPTTCTGGTVMPTVPSGLDASGAVSLAWAGATIPVLSSVGTPITLVLPATAAMAGCTFRFVLVQSGGDVAIQTAGGAQHGQTTLAGTLTTSTAGTTSFNTCNQVQFNTQAAVGDWIEITGMSATAMAVRAASGAVGGVTASNTTF